MSGGDATGYAQVREIGTELSGMVLEADPVRLREYVEEVRGLQRDAIETAPATVRDAVMGRVSDQTVLAAYALGFLAACEMVAEQGSRVRGKLSPNEEAALFVSDASKVARERGVGEGYGLRYEDDRIVVLVDDEGYDLKVIRKAIVDPERPYLARENPTTFVMAGQIIRHHGEAQLIAEHLASLAGRGPGDGAAHPRGAFGRVDGSV